MCAKSAVVWWRWHGRRRTSRAGAPRYMAGHLDALLLPEAALPSLKPIDKQIMRARRQADRGRVQGIWWQQEVCSDMINQGVAFQLRPGRRLDIQISSCLFHYQGGVFSN